MNGKSLSIGLGAGIVAIVLLRLPLHDYLPGLYVAEWPDASRGLAVLLVIIVCLAVIAGGYGAARWNRISTRRSGALNGAVVGMIAGALAYMALGSAAASTVGMAPILAYGPTPVGGEAQFMDLLVDSVTGIIWLAQLSYWGMTLGGIVLGVVGGVLVPPVEAGREEAGILDWYADNMAIPVAAVLSSALTVIVTITVYSELEDAVRTGVADHNLSPRFPAWGVFDMPVATQMILYVMSLIWVSLLLRAALQHNEDSPRIKEFRTTAFVTGGMTLVLLVLITLINPPAMINPVIVVGGLASLALAGWLLKTGFELGPRVKAALSDNSDQSLGWGPLRRHIPFVLAGSTWAMIMPIFPTIAAPLGLVLGPIVAIAILSNYGESFNPDIAATWTSASIVQDIFGTHSGALIAALVLAMISSLMGLLLVKVMEWLARRRQDKKPGSEVT